MSNHISSVINQNQDTNYSTIVKDNNIKNNSTIVTIVEENTTVVNFLLKEYKYLIHPKYKEWFAIRFYRIPFDQIHKAANRAKSSRSPQNYFASVINKLSLKYGV